MLQEKKWSGLISFAITELKYSVTKALISLIIGKKDEEWGRGSNYMHVSWNPKIHFLQHEE